MTFAIIAAAVGVAAGLGWLNPFFHDCDRTAIPGPVNPSTWALSALSAAALAVASFAAAGPAPAESDPGFSLFGAGFAVVAAGLAVGTYRSAAAKSEHRNRRYDPPPALPSRDGWEPVKVSRDCCR